MEGSYNSPQARPKTKYAKDLVAGDWVDFGTMTWQAGEPVQNGDTILIPWGNGSVSEYGTHERVTIFYPEESAITSRETIIARAVALGLTLSAEDIQETDGRLTVDGMDAHEWLRSMSQE